MHPQLVHLFVDSMAHLTQRISDKTSGTNRVNGSHKYWKVWSLQGIPLYDPLH